MSRRGRALHFARPLETGVVYSQGFAIFLHVGWAACWNLARAFLARGTAAQHTEGHAKCNCKKSGSREHNVSVLDLAPLGLAQAYFSLEE